MKLALLGSCVALTACVRVPDQSRFGPIYPLAQSDQAIVRVYGAPIPFLTKIAIHTWFITKPATRRGFDRWELWGTASGPYEHVRHDFMDPTEWLGSREPFVIAELIGARAEAVIDFIESRSPIYPCRKRYILVPGPNSNSYVKWMLEHTAWDVDLSRAAIGSRCRKELE